MVCDTNETDLNINIPAVMLPQDAGASLESNLKNGDAGEFFVYASYSVNGDFLFKFLREDFASLKNHIR